MNIITPRQRGGPPFPRWSIAGWIVWTAAFAASNHWALRGRLTLLITLVGVVSACSLATWAESRLYYRARQRGTLDATPVAVLLLGFGLVVVADVLLERFQYSGALLLLGLVSAVWFCSALLGSLLITLLDAGASALLKSFRSRMRALVITLIAATSVVSISVAPRLFETLTRPTTVTRWTSSGIIGQMARRAQTSPGVFELTQSSSPGFLFLFAVTLLVGLPVVASATAKFAGLLMERIYPLIAAFDAIAKGDRNVHVEEGGSHEFAQLSSHFNHMVDTLAMAERMERAFGSYVSTQLLERIRSQHGETTLAATTRDASVFFADIRGFTTMSEALSPEDVVQVLNLFFSRVVEVVDKHEGYLNKFVGDAVMVVFNGPIDQPDHRTRAVRCAVALQRAIAELNAQKAFPHVGAIRVGVGIASGPMVCGNVGSARQMEFTVIGDVVNTASRLCGQADGGEVWMTRKTAEDLPTDIVTQTLSPVQVKGKHEPVEVCSLRV